MSGPDDPRPGYDWDSYCSARDRFFARVRPQSMRNPPYPPCPEGVPEEWTAEQEEPRRRMGIEDRSAPPPEALVLPADTG